MRSSGGPSHFKPTGANHQKGHGSGSYIKASTVAPGNTKSYGHTTVKIKIRNHGPRSIRDDAYPYVNPVWAQDNFAEKYHFRKTPSGRSPLSSFQHAHMLKREMIHSDMHPMEHAMVHAEPSGYKCHRKAIGGVSTTQTQYKGGAPGKLGRLRLSGHSKAHQIGKR